MAEQYGAALRTAWGDDFVAALAGGSIKLFSGSLPANCAASDPATTLATGTLPSPAAVNTAGSVAKTGTWTITGGVGAGSGTVATVYRLYTSGAVCCAQGTVGPSYSADWVGSTAYTAGDRRKNGANVYLCATSGTSASSGGPTGTGSGISDGTAAWNYLGVAGDLGIDNTSIASGQVGAVTTYTRTMPGA